MMNRTQITDITPADNQHFVPDAEEALRLNRLLEELQPALRSLLPGHKALFLTVLHQLDGNGSLHSSAAEQHRFAPMSLTRAATEAISHLGQDGSFNESEASIMALCCLLYEYGCMYVPSLGSVSPDEHSPGSVTPITREELLSCKEYWHSQGTQPYAHPRTLVLIAPILSMIESSDPELVRHLRYILGTEAQCHGLIDSDHESLSKCPVEAREEQMRGEVLASMGRVFIKVRGLSEVPRSTELLRLTYVPAQDAQVIQLASVMHCMLLDPSAKRRQ